MRTERERVIYLLRSGTDIAGMTEILRAMGWSDEAVQELYGELFPVTTIENVHGKFYMRFNDSLET